MSTSNDPTVGTEEQAFIVTRTFDAPRELVFKAWTEPERLMQWWGPKGFALQVMKVDLRPGGLFHYSMRSPNGDEMWAKWVYREITPVERLVFVSSFSDPEGNTLRAPFGIEFPLEVFSTVTFTEHEGKTTITMHGVPMNPTGEEQQVFNGMFASMQQGWGGTLDQLESYLLRA